MRTLTLTIVALAVLALIAGCPETAVDETMPVPDPDPDSVWQSEEQEVGPDIEEVEEGEQVPDVTVPMVGGGETNLRDYEGKILVLDFWATWCAACVAELPDYQELYDSWDKEKVAYLGLSLDGDPSRVEAFLKGKPELELPMVMADDELVDAFLAKRTIPASRVIDQDGVIRYAFVGPGAEKVAEAVRRLQAEGAGDSEE